MWKSWGWKKYHLYRNKGVLRPKWRKEGTDEDRGVSCAGPHGPFQECGLIDKGMEKEDVVYITVEYYSAIKKNELMLFAAT